MVVRRVLNPTHPHSHYENEHRIGDLVQTRSPMFEPRQAMLVFSRQVVCAVEQSHTYSCTDRRALNGGRKLGAQQRLKKWGVLVRRKRHRILKEPLAAPGDSQQKGVHRYARYRISQSKSSNLYRNTAATCETPTAGQYEPEPDGKTPNDRELQKSLRQDLGHGIDTVDRDSNITLAVHWLVSLESPADAIESGRHCATIVHLVGYPEEVFNIWERKGSKVKSHPISCDRWIIGWSTPTYAQPPPRADTRRACNPLFQSWAVKLRRVDVNKMTRTNENGLALIEIQT
ncbi:hypothetical protein F5141DRAFT_1066323 [Pisolithus sp. B1]|nr:hypothetical protein F5141DRAFT_1066323 [Pisolithus sp. B1]